MSLIVNRDDVLSVYKDAASKGWVIPAFGAENQTTVEAVLSAAKEYGELIGCVNIPVTLAITNLYSHRSQSVNYTHTGKWDIGLRLFMSGLEILTSEDSPYSKLNVMVHLDHIQHDIDEPFLDWDMKQFSSIMFDASTLSLSENIEATSRFVERSCSDIVIEGACDEIVDAAGDEISELTTPDKAEEYASKTGVDMIVANLGTEHRASSADLTYHGDLAKKIKQRIGPKMVLHGCSSVSNDQIQTLFDDGICKVNIWTALERDACPALLKDMVSNASKVAGSETVRAMLEEGLLGSKADAGSKADLGYFTTVYRQDIVFREMKKIVNSYLSLWYI